MINNSRKIKKYSKKTIRKLKRILLKKWNKNRKYRNSLNKHLQCKKNKSFYNN